MSKNLIKNVSYFAVCLGIAAMVAGMSSCGEKDCCPPEKDTKKSVSPKKSDKADKHKPKKSDKADKSKKHSKNKETAFLDNLSSSLKPNLDTSDVEKEIEKLVAMLQEEIRLAQASTQKDGYQTLMFDPQSVTLDEEQKNLVSKSLREFKDAVDRGEKIVIKGHADILESNSDSYIHQIALGRAEVVKRELCQAGIPEKMIEIVSEGSSKPQVFNFDADKQLLESRANRRVDILIA